MLVSVSVVCVYVCVREVVFAWLRFFCFCYVGFACVN